jgi:hypothetical protein
MSDKSTDKAGAEKAYDPFEPWRAMRDASMDAWAKTMVDYVNSDAYSRLTGTMLEGYLTGSAPFRELLEKTMVRALEQLSMPSREDFVSLAQRLTNIEMRLDDLDAKLDRMVNRMDTARAKARMPRKTKENQ